MHFTVNGQNEHSDITLTERTDKDGILLLEVGLTMTAPKVPSPIRIQWEMDNKDIYSVWSPSIGHTRTVGVSWAMRRTHARLASGAPLHQMISKSGQNRLTVAIADTRTPTRISTGICEETARFLCEVVLFTDPVNALSEYHTTIYIDTLDRPYYESINAVHRYWKSECGYTPAFVPDTAMRPLYSCWYSFHQNIDVDAIVEQCKLAKKLGMESVIVDDGWQSADSSRGYAYCGDWEAAPEKVPNMKEFVDRVHETGMKMILWYATPFIGVHSKACARFGDMLLNPSRLNSIGYASLDPRFPEVRQYLTDILVRAVKAWGLDGLKLDFIDGFALSPETPPVDERRDCVSLEDGVERLLSEVVTTLKRHDPAFLIEFRQSYYGPTICKYGNMIRVGDCPNDGLANHVRGVDLRYSVSGVPAHSDMLMWHPDDPVESVAQQLIDALFCVPQISVLLDRIPTEHYKTLAFYLDFWNQNREVLLHGAFSAENPELLYSQVKAEKDGKTVAVAYTKPILSLNRFSSLHYINATGAEKLYLEIPIDLGTKHCTIRNCMGEVTDLGEYALTAGLHSFSVPRSGLLSFE